MNKDNAVHFKNIRGLCCGYDAPPVMTSIYFQKGVVGAPGFCESCGRMIGGDEDGHIIDPPYQLIFFLLSKSLLVPSVTRRQEAEELVDAIANPPQPRTLR